MLSARTAFVSATVAIAVATTTASSTTAGSGAVFARLGFVDSQIAAIMGLAMQTFDSFLRIFLGFHGHKAEAARASGHFVHDDVSLGNWAVGSEQVTQFVLSGIERKVPNKQFCTHE
jgi:hypothetical protein